MTNTPPLGKELPNKKGKEKASESSNAANLNLNEPVIDQGAVPSTKNKGKEIMMVAKQTTNPINNKRKAVVLGGPDHCPRDDSGSKNPRSGGIAPFEEGVERKQNSPPSLKEPIISGNNKKKKTDAPLSYTCDFCDRSFVSPQALGGHQNGHKWERHMRNGMDVIHMAMERGSSMEPPPPPQLSTGAQGPSLLPMNMNQHLLHMKHQYYNNNNTMMMNALTMGNENQYDVPFQHGVGTPSLLDAAGVENNTAPFYAHWAGAGFATGPFGAVEIGNNGGYHYPEGPWFNSGYENGFGSYGALDPGYRAFHHQEGAWFNPEYQIDYNGSGASNYDPFQQPELAWMNHGGIRTGYNGGLNNTYGLNEQIDNSAYDLTQLQHGGSGGTPSEIDEFHEFVLLPDPLTQDVGMVEIDFGLVPKGDDDGDAEEDTESQKKEEEAIDLTLKL